MAKIAIGSDLSAASQLTNLWATPTIMAVREFGALEYDETLTINVSGAKPICKYDLAPYSMLVDKAGSLPTTADMRGKAVAGAQREGGALEYDSTLAFANTPKLVGMSDLSGYSQLINYTRISSSAPYLPTTKDKRGSAAQLNAKFSHDITHEYQTTKDIRGTAALGGFREMGALEYNNSLVILDVAPTAGENAQAIWNELYTSHTLAGSYGLLMGSDFFNLMPAAVWNQLMANIYTSSTIGKLIKDYLDVAISSRLATAGYTTPPTVGAIGTQITSDHGTGSYVDTGTSVTLTAAALDAILDRAADGTHTLRDAIKVLLAEMAGKASGGGTVAITYRDPLNTKDRVIMTVDANGNRSAVTLDLS